MGFPRQKYWSGLPFPSPGNCPYPGIKPMSPVLAGRFFKLNPRQVLCLLIFALVVLAFSVKLKKKSLSRPISMNLPSMLSSRNFMVSGFESDLMLWPYIQVLKPFRVYFCVWCKIGVQFHYFACLSGTIFWTYYPSPLNILHSFVV